MLFVRVTLIIIIIYIFKFLLKGSVHSYTSFIVINLIFEYTLYSVLHVKPGSQYDAGASVASRTSRASSAKTGVPVHNLASVAS